MNRSFYSMLVVSVLLMMGPAQAERFPWTPKARPIYKETKKADLTTYKDKGKNDFGYLNNLKRKKSREKKFRDYQDGSSRKGTPSFYSPSQKDNWRSRFYDSKANTRRGTSSAR